MPSGSRPLRGAVLGAAALWITIALTADRASAQAAVRDGQGRIAGRVLDASSGEPVEGVTVVLTHAEGADGGNGREELRSTGADGAFAFEGVPPGKYRVDYTKSGYRPS